VDLTFFTVQISKNKRVSVRSWNGKVMVDVREFYVKDGKDLPGRKGTAVFLPCSVTAMDVNKCEMCVACGVSLQNSGSSSIRVFDNGTSLS
jgi:hypothetical protein